MRVVDWPGPRGPEGSLPLRGLREQVQSLVVLRVLGPLWGPEPLRRGLLWGEGQGAEVDLQKKHRGAREAGTETQPGICEDTWSLEVQRPSGHHCWGGLRGAVVRPGGLAGLVARLVRYPSDARARATGAGGLRLRSHVCLLCTLENNVFCLHVTHFEIHLKYDTPHRIHLQSSSKLGVIC